MGQVQCLCGAGTQWNGFSCVSIQDQAGSGGASQGYGGSEDCSAYPGTSAVWNAAMGGMQCVCPQGTQWTGSSCASANANPYAGGQQDPNNPFNIFGQQGGGGSADCSAWPGTSAVWNAAMGGMQCVCPQGTEWTGSSCVSPNSYAGGQQQDPNNPFNIFGAGNQGGSNATDCSAWPGTSAVWNAAMGGMQCVCSQGTQWNGSSCVSQGGESTTPPANNPPVDLISPIANAAAGGGPTFPSQPAATSCPAGTVNIGGNCYTQTSGGPVSGIGGNQPPPQIQGGGGGVGQGSDCPPGSINLLGVCSEAYGSR